MLEALALVLFLCGAASWLAYYHYDAYRRIAKVVIPILVLLMVCLAIVALWYLGSELTSIEDGAKKDAPSVSVLVKTLQKLRYAIQVCRTLIVCIAVLSVWMACMYYLPELRIQPGNAAAPASPSSATPV